MKYCTECSSEYQDSVTRCADCGGTELVGAAEMKKRGLLLANEVDTRKFVRATTTDDPLSSDAMVAVLEGAEIPVFARPRRDDSTAMPWWEILVPEDQLAKATPLLKDERDKMAANADEAAKAAEEEEKETEGTGS